MVGRAKDQMSKARYPQTLQTHQAPADRHVASVRFVLSVRLVDPTMAREMQRPECYAAEGFALVETALGVIADGHGATVLVPWANVREVRYT